MVQAVQTMHHDVSVTSLRLGWTWCGAFTARMITTSNAPDRKRKRLTMARTIKLNLSIGHSGSKQEDECELDEEEYGKLQTEDEKQDYLHEIWLEWIWNFIDGCALIEDE